MSDRPLLRRLIKLGFRLGGGRYAHAQDIWPGLAINRISGLATWQGQVLCQLLPLSAVFPADADLLAVVGSGPSVADQDLTKLPANSAILLNGAAVLADRLDPLAVAVEDERFVFRHFAMLAGLDKSIPLLLSPAAIRAVAERDPAVLSGRAVVLIDNLAKPVDGAGRLLTDPALDDIVLRGGMATLSINPDQGVVIMGTVALSALQCALYMQPKRIILVGIDLNNASAAPRFYEAAGNRAASGIVAGLDRILAGFDLAYKLAQSRNIALLCASPRSALLTLGIPRTDILE